MGPAASAPRLVSLDAFRGLTIAAMILVNNPGSWSFIYWPLDHAKWFGWTPTDLIFPFFLFMVGMAMNFSHKGTFRQALRRAAILFGLGLFMAAYGFFDLQTVRIPGVLQRIALCYLAAWVVRRFLGPLGEGLVAAVLLIGYWWLMTAVPVPGFGPPNLAPETNLGAFLDRLLLSGHLWKQTKTWDPEGLLSTIPAVATTLLGSLAGHWIRTPRGSIIKTAALLGAGLVLTLAGLAWGLVFPLSKNLWTSSYVLFTAGLAAYLFALVYYVVDVVGHRSWVRPAVVYGRNAILVFVASGLVAKTLYLIKLPTANSGPLSLQAHLHRALFASWLPPYDASLAFALANVTFLLWMDRRGWYLKV